MDMVVLMVLAASCFFSVAVNEFSANVGKLVIDTLYIHYRRKCVCRRMLYTAQREPHSIPPPAAGEGLVIHCRRDLSTICLSSDASMRTIPAIVYRHCIPAVCLCF